MSSDWIEDASGRRNVKTVSHAAANSSGFRCALKAVSVVELFVTGDSEFQTAGDVMLNALDWKLILVAD